MKSNSLILGGLLSALVVIAALVSFLWVPFDITQLSIPDKLQTPNEVHWLGTDHFGRDILSMIMIGARTSLAVAILAVGIGFFIGVPLGLAAATKKNSLLDETIMRTNDLIFAFPSLVIAILITALFGAGAMNAIIAIGIFNIPVFARVSRGAALSLWQKEFILAARVSGKSDLRISAEHIFPILLTSNSPRHNSIFTRYLGRGGIELCWTGDTTAGTKLGAYACRCTNYGQLCSSPGNHSRVSNNRNRSRVEFNGGWSSRSS